MTVWNERYNTEEYVYGTKPNDFIASVIEQLPKGRLLSLAAGEGRNCVFLAKRGMEVHSVDSAHVGLEKAKTLAAENGVTIHTETADLADYEIAPASWDVIVSVFAHVPPEIRRPLHRKVVNGLKSGGAFVLEAYTPKQLEFKTGGPPVPELTMTLEGLREELDGLEFRHGLETERDVVEGRLHTGRAAVVQVVAFKP
jgi:SAM-dependent methyltransferase